MVISKHTMTLFEQLWSRGLLDQPKLPKIKAPNTGGQDYATYMLQHVQGDPQIAKMFGQSIATRQAAESEKASLLSTLFDTLSVPLYAAGNIVQGDVENSLNLLGDVGIHTGGAYKQKPEGVGKDLLDLVTNRPKRIAEIPGTIGKIIQEGKLANPVSAAYSSLPGEPKTTGQNILHEDLGVNNPVARYGGGLAIDLVMDPLSYVGIGLGKKIKDATELPEKILDLKAAAGENPFVKPESLGERLKRLQEENGPIVNPEEARFKKIEEIQNRQAGTSVSPESKPSSGQSLIPNRISPVPVAEDALGSSSIPNLRGTIPEIPRQDISKFTKGFKFDPAPPELARRFAIQNEKVATDVERGLADVPNPARNSTQKMQRAQNDWERAMVKSGQVADNSGQISVRAASQVVNDILSGKVATYVAKSPRAPTEELGQVARNTADKLIDNLMGSKRSAKGTFQKRLGIKEINPALQVRLLSEFTAHAKDIDVARGMLATAEDHLITLGVQPLGPGGNRVRLSDVLELTKDRIPFKQVLDDFKKADIGKMSPPVRSIVRGLIAQRTLTMSELTANLSKLTEEASKKVLEYTPKRKPTIEKQILETATGQALQKGMTSAEIKAVLDLGKQVLDVDKLPAETAVMTMQKELVRAVNEGRVDSKVLDKFNRAVADTLGTTYENLSHKVTNNMAIDGFMTRVATHWGKGEFLNYAKDVFTAGEEVAAARAQAMTNIAKNYAPEEIKAAWNHVTGAVVTEDAKALELSNFFGDYMDQVFKVQMRGLNKTNPINEGASVAERSMTMMEDINRHMKDVGGAEAFQFTKKARGRTHNPLAAPQDFSKPGDWLKSWSTWNPSDPVAFMFNIDTAMERTVREYAFLDEYAARFGSLTKDAEHTFGTPLSRIKGYYVHPEIGKQMLRVMDDMRKGNWKAGDPVTKFLSRGLRIWKTGVTIYLPSHHVRNGIGDTYLMWLAGHNDPRAFIRARRVMGSQRTKYKNAIKHGDFKAIDELTDPDAIKWAATEGKDIILNRNGVKVSADQLYNSAFNLGLLRDANKMEDIYGEAPLGEVSAVNDGLKKLISQPLGGHVHKAAMDAAEYREHYIRLAHFTSAVDKGLKHSTNLKAIMESAAHEVRKWHPDGTDLTYFEQKYMRNIIPFYSWLRKSTPLLIQGLVQRPAKQLAYPRINVALQQMMGVDASLADPYPNDQLFPEWIRAYGIGPIGDPESANPFTRWWGNLGKNMINPDGSTYGYTVINPSNPFIDAGQQYLGFGPKDTIKGVGDSITPFAKVPAELIFGRTTLGAPIYKSDGGQGVPNYLSKQLPFTAPIQRVTNTGDRQREGVEPGLDQEALINLMTALGVHGTGPYIKTGEFEAKRRATNGQ